MGNWLALGAYFLTRSLSVLGGGRGVVVVGCYRAEQSRAEQSRAEQSRAEQSRAEQSRAEQSDLNKGNYIAKSA